jgi:hypothetical protein
VCPVARAEVPIMTRASSKRPPITSPAAVAVEAPIIAAPAAAAPPRPGYLTATVRVGDARNLLDRALETTASALETAADVACMSNDAADFGAVLCRQVRSLQLDVRDARARLHSIIDIINEWQTAVAKANTPPPFGLPERERRLVQGIEQSLNGVFVHVADIIRRDGDESLEMSARAIIDGVRAAHLDVLDLLDRAEPSDEAVGS